MTTSDSKELFAATVIATDTTTTGILKSIRPHSGAMILESIVSARTDGTYTTTLQHSPDGTNWTNVLMSDGSTAFAGAAQSANGRVYKYLLKDVPTFGLFRASILSSSTSTGATVQVKLHYSPVKA
jgi:predicted hotdog family 3-hydroxylacyl-ACP dehydratase